MAPESGKSLLQIWREMDSERRRQAAEAFFAAPGNKLEQKALEQVIAGKYHLRPQTAAKLPAERKAGYLASLTSLDAMTAGTLIRSYLFVHHKEMLTRFLDDLNIKHKEGAITEENLQPPSAESLRGAVEKIRSAFTPSDVDFYLSALQASDAETWQNLEPSKLAAD